MSGISRSQVSRLCEEIDGKVKAFLERPIEGDWPYLWIDATYLKVRRGGRIVSVAVIIAVGVNTDGRREALGMAIGGTVKNFVLEAMMMERRIITWLLRKKFWTNCWLVAIPPRCLPRTGCSTI